MFPSLGLFVLTVAGFGPACSLNAVAGQAKLTLSKDGFVDMCCVASIGMSRVRTHAALAKAQDRMTAKSRKDSI